MSDDLTGLIDSFATRDKIYDPYFFWEPFDCEAPSEEVIAKAKEDGVDLLHDEGTMLSGRYPRLFQSGFVLSNKKTACIQASSQTGKSIANAVVLGASMSRKPPYSLRYEKGEDTGIQRIITPENITRYGRRDSVNGELIDYDINSPMSPTEWNCGNIVGAGKFPEELYCPEGKQIWVGTLARSIDTYWWKALAGRGQERFIPLEFLDQTRGNHGTDKSIRAVYGPRDTTIFLKSYDSDREAFETVTCHLLLWDEEPPKKELFISGQGHAVYQRWSFTPFNGFGFTHGLFFGCVSQVAQDRAQEYGIGCMKREDFDYFLATQYDCPYQNNKTVDTKRNTYPLWERKAVVWGRYSRQQGQPFFNRDRIEVWRQKRTHSFVSKIFDPERSYHGINGGFNIPGIMQMRVNLKEAPDDAETAWRIYEPVRKGVAYVAVFDAAEGGTDPDKVQDKSFGMIVRQWQETDDIKYMNYPIVVAVTRCGLPTVVFAKSILPVLRYYNNATLAAERGHGKDNEAFGLTLDEWPYWYYSTAKTSNTIRKGFDTHAGTRSTMLAKIQEWLRNFEVDEDPMIRDSMLFEELGEAIVKETQAGKKKCDHPKHGSLDGVICLGIATYILQEAPETFVCNYIEEEREKTGFLHRFRQEAVGNNGYKAMGAGIAQLNGR